MAENQIQSVSHRHEAIANYLIANPEAKLKSVAMEFGITGAWLSVVIHSSSFQTLLREKQDIVFNDEICATIQDRLKGVASITTDRLLELVPMERDVKVLNDTMDKTLKALGYGQKVMGGPVQQNNTLVINGGQITADTLNRARSLVGAAKNVMEGEPLDNSEHLGSNDIPKVAQDREGDLGAFSPTAPFLLTAPEPEAKLSEGVKV